MKTDRLIMKQVQDTGRMIFFKFRCGKTYIIEKLTTTEVYI